MFKIRGLDHIVLKTTNLNAMLHFYCDILGCQIEQKQPEISLTQLRAGEHIIDIVEVKEKALGQNLEHFCLRIQPFHYEKLKPYFESHNITLLRYGERYGSQGLGPSFYLNDPEGNMLELTEQK